MCAYASATCVRDHGIEKHTTPRFPTARTRSLDTLLSLLTAGVYTDYRTPLCMHCPKAPTLVTGSVYATSLAGVTPIPCRALASDIFPCLTFHTSTHELTLSVAAVACHNHTPAHLPLQNHTHQHPA